VTACGTPNLTSPLSGNIFHRQCIRRILNDGVESRGCLRQLAARCDMRKVMCRQLGLFGKSQTAVVRLDVDLSRNMLYMLRDTHCCCFDLRLCPRYRSCLPQTSHLAGFEIVTSVAAFGRSRRHVRFAGKHVHRPAKLLHRGSCRLERTSTRPPLTAQQSPTVPI